MVKKPIPIQILKEIAKDKGAQFPSLKNKNEMEFLLEHGDIIMGKVEK